MKILFCTNAFENVTNGPAKFANLLLKINETYSEHQIKILTEDVSSDTKNVYKLNIKYPKILKLFSHYFRIQQYHNKAKEIKEKEYNWDVIVYNNAFIGMKSAAVFKNTVGMINDDNNATTKFGFSYLKIRYFIFKKLEKIATKRFKLILTNSIYTKNILTKVYPALKNKCEILYKGIELNSNEITPNFNTPITILFVKKDFNRGGLLYLLNAISLIDFNISLKIIGPKLEELNSDYKKIIQNSKHSIQVLGPKPQQETFRLMQETDIFCVPSLQEALGVANIEAMSFGCSVISTNVGGIPEVLNYGKNGWLVAPKSEKEIAKAIIECCENSELREKKRKNAYEYIKKFNIDHTIDNFVTILKNKFT